jgi:hypothetical protein
MRDANSGSAVSNSDQLAMADEDTHVETGGEGVDFVIDFDAVPAER